MQVAAASEAAFPEAQGLEKAFHDHHMRVLRAAWRITGNTHDAEDVLQTVFLRLAQKGDLGAGNAASYLYRAAVNASIDLLRTRRQGSAVPLEDAARTARAPETPETLRQGGEIRERLRRALAALPPAAAEIFALRYFEGHPNRDIARMLGISRVGVAVTLHRTRHRLQREFRQEGTP